MNVMSVCLSIQSMLSSCTKKVRWSRCIYTWLQLLQQFLTSVFIVHLISMVYISFISIPGFVRNIAQSVIHYKVLWCSHLMQVRPPDDTIYVRFATKNPKKTRWVFHGECI